MLGMNGRGGRGRRGIRRWVDWALRPWNPEIREPRLKHLGILGAKIGISAAHIAAVFSSLQEASLEVLDSKRKSGELESEAFHLLAKVVRKRLATEQLGLLSVHSDHRRRRLQAHIAERERKLQHRAVRLSSTVSLSQAIADEIDESTMIRTLARHVMNTFAPDYLAIHIIEGGDLVETPVTIVDGEVVDCGDDAPMQALRKDWSLCRAARTGRLFHVADVSNPLIKCEHQACEQSSGSYCCVPLAGGTEVLGWMHLRRNVPHAFSEEDLEVLSIYGQMVQTALRSLRLLKENRHQAATDPLTGLDNRRCFETMLTREQRVLERRDGRVCVLMADVDRFKEVNDTLGHEVGDQILKALADTLRNSIRQSDEVARIGGDEFVLLLRDCDGDNGLKVAEKITREVGQKRLRSPTGKEFQLALSLGVAACPQHAQTLAETVTLADAALLRAKNSGRNQSALFNPEIDSEVLATRSYGSGIML